MAMPPADAPMPPQAETAEQPQGGGEDPKQLIIDVHTGLAKIVQMVEGKAPEPIVKQLEGSLQAFRSAMEALMGGGGQPQPADSGSSSPEQGGNPNAVPMA